MTVTLQNIQITAQGGKLGPFTVIQIGSVVLVSSSSTRPPPQP
jgi:hypothetical protein